MYIHANMSTYSDKNKLLRELALKRVGFMHYPETTIHKYPYRSFDPDPNETSMDRVNIYHSKLRIVNLLIRTSITRNQVDSDIKFLCADNDSKCLHQIDNSKYVTK